MIINQLNPLVLAYIGDSIYELYIREFLIKKDISNVNDLQTEAKKYVSAISQSKIIKDLIEENYFSEEEIDVIKRARNTKTNSHPKNTDIITYKYATALEALIGYLYLTDNRKRVDELINYITNKF